MNLNAYDKIETNINKQKSWIDTRNKKLFSREIKYRRYYAIYKKYNVVTNCNDYFLILSDVNLDDSYFKETKTDNYGRVKIPLNSIWNISNLINIKENTNINIEIIEQNELHNVYYIDI